MAVAQSMHQIAPHTWTFEAPSAPTAPMKGSCRACGTTVGIQNAEGVILPTGNYVVRGQCQYCGDEVVLIIS